MSGSEQFRAAWEAAGRPPVLHQVVEGQGPPEKRLVWLTAEVEQLIRSPGEYDEAGRLVWRVEAGFLGISEVHTLSLTPAGVGTTGPIG